MAVNKILSAPSVNALIAKINEIIDALGSDIAIDDLTITENSSNQLQTVAVKDNRSGNAIKTWTGTKAQYEAITTKDSNTIYNITDDTDVTLSLLELLYPVGSIYIGSSSLSACPLAVIGVGNWILKSANSIVTDVNGIGDTAPVKGNGISLGWTDGNGGDYGTTASNYSISPRVAGYGVAVGTARSGSQVNPNYWLGITTDGSKSGMVADLSNVSTETISVKIWERIS